MKGKARKQYKAPRVSTTYPKAQLDKAVRPHGQVSNYSLPGDIPTAPN